MLRRIALASLLLLAAAGRAGAEPAGLAIACGAVGVELRLCEEDVAAWSERTGVAVRIVSTPNSSTDRLALYQQMLAAGTDDIDVFQIDVVWPGILASHLADLSPYAGGRTEAHFPALIENATVAGRLVALPWWTDAGVLFYRDDLLAKHGFAPPETWQELTRTAEAVLAAERAAGNVDLVGFVWQGRAYEGLTCNALEWLASFGAGAILGPDGRPAVDNPQAADALRLAASWVGGISPIGVLNYDEEAARGVFQSGNALFMRNWPYAWALANGPDSPVRGKVGVAALPKGGEQGRHAGTLGGWNAAVSKYSRQPALAADLALFLTSAERQKRRAIVASYIPTMPALYRDAEVLAANPLLERLFETVRQAVARPSRFAGARYNRFSAAVWQAVHGVLSGRAEVGPALANLQRRLDRLGRRRLR